MMINTKEHYDVMAQFESEHRHFRLDREPKDFWTKGNVYQDGMANASFLAYRRGYAFGKTVQS